MRTSAGTCVVLPVLPSWAPVGQLASVELPIWGYLFCGKPRVSSVTPLGHSQRNSHAVTAHYAGQTSAPESITAADWSAGRGHHVPFIFAPRLALVLPCPYRQP
jgi:hypothetical protein